MSRLSRTLLLSALALSIALPLPSQAAMKIDRIVKAAFYAVGNPGFLDIVGEITQMTVSDDGTNLVFTVPMASVKTGIDERDEHMNNTYIEVAKYPNAVLTLKKADVKWPTEMGASEEGTVSATFNVHGKDQAVTVKYGNRKSKTGWRVTATFSYNTAAAGMTKPTYLGVGVEEQQKAEITIDLSDS